MIKKYVLVFVILPVFFFAGFAWAQNFSEAIPEIPVMPGLIELPDRIIMFDKAEGRIVQTAFSLDQLKEADVMAYYQEVLPQFGWRLVSDSSSLFVREGEILKLKLENHMQPPVLVFSISPDSQ